MNQKKLNRINKRLADVAEARAKPSRRFIMRKVKGKWCRIQISTEVE